MINLKEDYHIHTNYNDHSASDLTIENVIKQAELKQLELIALTEHVRKTSDWVYSYIDEISKFKTRGKKDMYVFGSANLSETFINDNQFDEYRIGIAPVILGNGRPLFRDNVLNSKKLALISVQELSTGGAILKYKPGEGRA